MKDPTLSELQVRGGKAVLKKYGKGYFKELAKKSAEVRKKKRENNVLKNESCATCTLKEI